VNGKKSFNRVPKFNKSSSVKHRARFVMRVHSDLSRLVVDSFELHHTKHVSFASPSIPLTSIGSSGPNSCKGRERNSQD